MKQILILDEDAASFKLLKKYLTSFGYKVTGTSVGGLQAVDTARKSHPDIVLIDSNMPGGFDGARAASQITRELEIPLIIIADRADDELIAKAKDAVAGGFILKPVNPGELKAAVEIALGDKRAHKEFKDLTSDLIEQTNDLVYIMDGKGNIKYVNNRISEKLGYTYHDIIGMAFKDFINPQSFTNTFEIFRRQLKGEDVGAFEIELVGRDGTVTVIETREMLKWENGRVAEVYGIGRDITVRKHAEEALRREKDRAQKYLDIAGVMILVLDTSGAVTLINRMGCEILGYAEDEILGKNWFDNFLPKKSKKEVKEIFSHITEGRAEHHRNQEGVILCRDGSQKFIAWHNTAVTDERGTIVATLSSGEDITERKRAEAELSLNERRLEGLLQLTQMTEASEQEIIQFALEQGVELTGSRIGYFHFVNPDQVDLTLFTWSKNVYKSCTAVKDEKYPIEAAGVWIDSFRTRKPVIHNDYRNLPGKKGYPEGHIHVTRHMSVPVFDGDIIVAVAGVGNKDRPYNETDVRQLSVFMNSMWEILRRKRAEGELEDQFLFLQSLIDSIPTPIFYKDADGRYIGCNAAFAYYLGKTKDKIIGKTVYDISPKELADFYYRKDRELLDNHITQSYETRVHHGDGSFHDVVFNKATFHDRSGALGGLVGIIMDVTHLRKTEAALRESEEKYRSMVENINDVFVNLDTNGIITYIGPAIQAMSGYRPDEMIGEDFSKFIHPDDLPGLITSLERSLKGIKEEAEFRIITKDGTPRFIRSLSNIIMRDGSVVGLTGVLTDIDWRKKAEAALKESEKKFRSLFETSRDVVYISTVEGSFIDVNTAAEKTFGYTHNELLTINAKDLFKDPGDRERFKHVVDRDGFVKDHEVQMKKKDGTIIDCLITSTVRRDPEGAIVGYQGIIRDVTERIRLRRRLVQAEKLSSLGAMISGVAHEINNPLTSIIGNTQLLMKKEIAADFRSKLEVIKRESLRCTKIVAGLLSFAREHRPERRMIDINAVVAESLQLREYDLAVNNIRLNMSLADDLPRTSADPFQLQQVFIILINNSHDALREKGGGTLSIRSFSKDHAVHVEFADDGPGIAPDDLTRIFDPFFTTKDIGKGTGLGLSIAYGIVNEHGGTIDVESPPGNGAKFDVVIPLVETLHGEQ